MDDSIVQEVIALIAAYSAAHEIAPKLTPGRWVYVHTCIEKNKKKRLTMIESRVGDESSGSWTFQVGVSGSGGVADALQVVMPEGRTPGRHDGRDAEVRRFSPFPLRRHPF